MNNKIYDLKDNTEDEEYEFDRHGNKTESENMKAKRSGGDEKVNNFFMFSVKLSI